MSLRRLLFSSLMEGDRGESTGEKRAGRVQKAGIEGAGSGTPKVVGSERNRGNVAKCT